MSLKFKLFQVLELPIKLYTGSRFTIKTACALHKLEYNFVKKLEHVSDNLINHNIIVYTILYFYIIDLS